jgi:hypothetical protein
VIVPGAEQEGNDPGGSVALVAGLAPVLSAGRSIRPAAQLANPVAAQGTDRGVDAVGA